MISAFFSMSALPVRKPRKCLMKTGTPIENRAPHIRIRFDATVDAALDRVAAADDRLTRFEPKLFARGPRTDRAADRRCGVVDRDTERRLGIVADDTDRGLVVVPACPFGRRGPFLIHALTASITIHVRLSGAGPARTPSQMAGENVLGSEIGVEKCRSNGAVGRGGDAVGCDQVASADTRGPMTLDVQRHSRRSGTERGVRRRWRPRCHRGFARADARRGSPLCRQSNRPRRTRVRRPRRSEYRQSSCPCRATPGTRPSRERCARSRPRAPR